MRSNCCASVMFCPGLNLRTSACPVLLAFAELRGLTLYRAILLSYR